MSLRAALFEDGHIAFDGAGHDLYQFKYESFARRDKLSHFPSVQKFDVRRFVENIPPSDCLGPPPARTSYPR